MSDELRPMDEAPKDGAPILARIRPDLAAYRPHYGWSDPDRFAGLYVVIRHQGIAPDGFDPGWSLNGPFGHGLGGDDIFSGWRPLPQPPEDAR